MTPMAPNAYTGNQYHSKLAGVHYGNGNSSFGESYVLQNLCGLNYIINGLQTTTRYNGSPGTGFPTTVAMAGLPVGFVVQKAYVYYGASYTEAIAPATSVAITNPAAATSTIASVLIGTGHSVCWGETGTATYRCDVTSMISGNGNYDINLTGFNNAAYEVDGVSLIIMYVDPAGTYSGNIVLWDGDMANFTGSSMTYVGDGFTACTNSSAGSAFSLQGDCQNNVFPPNNTDNYNGSIATFPNNFWNTNVVATSVSACDSTSTFIGYTNNTNDCWLWSMVGLYWQYATCSSCSSMTVTDNAVDPSCGNNSGSITLNVTGGTSPYTYTWSPNVSTSASATGLSAGTYQIVVHDAGCNVQTLNVTLTMVNLIITDSVNGIHCNGQANASAYFTVSGGISPYTYSWAPIANTTSSATGLSAGTYTVSIEDNVGCQNNTILSITQPAALSATNTITNPICNGGIGSIASHITGGVPPYTYLWAPSGQTTATATGLSAGTYNLSVTDSNGCPFSTSATITEPGAMSVTVSGPSIICTGSSGTLTANVSGGTSPYSSYVWTPGNLNGSSITISPASAQTYTVVVTDANGCTASGQIAVATGPSMSVSISGAHSICAGLSTTLCASVNGGTGGNQYTWLPGNLTTPCITVSPNSTTTYSLQVTDNCSTEASATATLRVNPLPATAFTANLSTGCAPLCIQFYNTTTLSQGSSATYLWTFGNGDSSTAQNPINCYPSSGRYSVNLTVISDSGCSSTLSKVGMITAYAKPAGAFTFSPETPTMLNPTVQFADNSYDQYNIVYWIWNFGDGSDSASNQQRSFTHVSGYRKLLRNYDGNG